MKALDVVILAAGKGTRMKSSLPKVMMPIAGKPILSHIIAAAKTLDPRDIVVVVGQQPQQYLWDQAFLLRQ